jgi:dTDP-4-amino-4,6-dideoxygalactose transaminase
MLRFHGSAAKKEFVYVGYNSRLDAMQASFLRIFLRHLDRWNSERREAAARYTELLEGVVELPVDEPGHVYHQFCIRSPERDRISSALTEAQIGHAIYYSPPLHLQPALRYLGYADGAFPVTEQAARENLCLPLWAGITEEQQAEVAAVVRRAAELVAS